MQKIKIWLVVIVFLTSVLVLSACGSIAIPTPTPLPPTPTNTAVPPTNTPVPPTATPTNTSVPPTPTPTNTPVPPTPTPRPPTLAPTAALPRAGEERVFGDARMMFVSAGDFLMGSRDDDTNAYSDEKPQHTVSLDAFWIDKTEVTNAQYTRCVQARVCRVPSDLSSYTRSSYYGTASFDNYPVIFVSWNDADKFCKWVGKRLPTEAEWEKAARGADGRIYPWGNTFDKSRLNSYDGGRGDTSVVGDFPSGASPYGVMDMAGNVWEWVADWYDENYYRSAPRNNPTGPASGQYRALRGGAWTIEDRNARAPGRGWDVPADVLHSIGFRCARGFSP